MTLVIDASMALSWFFPDEDNEASVSVRQRVSTQGAYVPSLWPTEFANALLMAERRGRISWGKVSEIVGHVRRLTIYVLPSPTLAELDDLLAVARQHRLTLYDASYLVAAINQQMPLASLDKELIAAAKSVGVPVLPA